VKQLPTIVRIITCWSLKIIVGTSITIWSKPNFDIRSIDLLRPKPTAHKQIDFGALLACPADVRKSIENDGVEYARRKGAGMGWRLEAELEADPRRAS